MNGLIIFSYNSLRSIDDVYDFYNHLFQSKRPPEVINQYVEKFRLFGTVDLSTYYTNLVGESIVNELSETTDEKWKLYIGSKHTTPFVEEAIELAIKDGCTRLYTLSLSPLHSKTGYILYLQKVSKVIERLNSNVEVVPLGDYWEDENFIKLLAKRLRNTYDYTSKEDRENNKVKIIFTSHSIPGTEASNKDFIYQYHKLGSLILSEAKLENVACKFVYRSVGPETQKWLRPDICDVLKNEQEEGTKTIVVFDLLSLIANLEVVLELGEEAKQAAIDLGISFFQVPYLNDSYDFVKFLIDQIKSKNQ